MSLASPATRNYLPQIPKWKLMLLVNDLLKKGGSSRQNKKSKLPKKGSPSSVSDLASDKTKRPANVGKRKLPTKRKKKDKNAFKDDPLEGWDTSLVCSRNFSHRILMLTRKLVVTHRWTSLAKLFSLLVSHRQSNQFAAWKAGCLTLLNHPNKKHELLKKFSTSMVELGVITQPDFILDHVSYLISIGEFLQAKGFLETYKVKTLKADESLLAVIHGYQGLVTYYDWLQRKHKREMNSDLEVIDEEDEHYRDFPEGTAKFPDSAVAFLKMCLRSKGNHDAFITHLYDILDQFGEVNELDKVLQTYISINPTQPSPYLFMYKFLLKHHPNDKSRQVSTLEDLLRYCPSDYHAVDLCKLLPDEEAETKFEKLINLLDYQEWKDNIHIWTALAKLLMDINKSSPSGCLGIATISNLVADRLSWWPMYHFNSKMITIDNHESAKLASYKTIVLMILIPTEMVYVDTVKELLLKGNWTRELKILKKLFKRRLSKE